MINNCNNRNPLLRDGTSQQQRLLKALLPGYVSVDERSMDDLIAFAREFAKEIQFYGVNDLPDGHWQDFFRKSVTNDERTEPHYALFIAFLEMFRFAQDDLNTITRRHLEFYYKDVLRIKEREAIPDQVYVIFDLAKHASSNLIEKGTVLNAGKDKTGKRLFYTVDKDIVVNTAKVKELKALYLELSSSKLNDKGRIYASPVANSADGKGLPIETPEPRWRTFGNPSGGPARPQAEIGFAMASPLLALAEGTRSIKIFLTVREDASSASPSKLVGFNLRDSFKVVFSGEKEWLAPELDPLNITTDTELLADGRICITRTISESQPAIVPYNDAVLKEGYKTQWPVVKVLLNKESNLYAYNTLKDVRIASAEIQVDVQKVKNLILQNDLSKLDPAKPFQPFTSRPVIGSKFMIGSKEIFSKKLDELQVNIEWQDVPEAFGKHYRNYYGFSPKNQSFQAEISILEGKQWKLLKQDYLFEQLPPAVPASNLANLQTLVVQQMQVAAGAGKATLSPDGIGPIILTCLNASSDQTLRSERNITINTKLNYSTNDPHLADFKVYDVNTEKGFMMMELTCSDFGHKFFQPSYTAKVLQLTRLPGEDPNNYLPKEPYTPTIKAISLDYKASATISFADQLITEEAYNSRIDQYFHVHPFGYAEVHRYTSNTTTPSLLPQFVDEGTLYIGLEKLKPSQTLSLLFKVAEGSADPELPKKNVTWSYLVNNEWKTFPQLNILADSTNGLLTTGIITFDVPKAASSTNTILPGGQHWLRATVTDNTGAICDMVSITAQAVTATFDDKGNDPDHLRESLPASTVKELEESDSAISKVLQPFASFGGKLKEEGNEFYIRVSERLRHKNRAITIWDYEHLVLEQFPSVYKVKCLNHAINGFKDDKYVYSEIAPGHVTLITISNLRNKNAVDPLKPKTSLIMLEEIKSFITKINPPCSTLHVVNPTFEEIQLRFNVRFHPGYDNGFYGKQLEKELKQFLAPWAYDSTDITLGGKLHRSVVINFIEEREYVDFVTCVKMDLLAPSGNLLDIEEATARTSSSVLTSAEKHLINVLETDDCECSDNIIQGPAPADEPCSCESESESDKNSATGIGVMTLGTSFIIGIDPSEGIGNLEIENDFDIQ